MKLLRVLRQFGFSIPEAMIGLGLLGGLGVAGMTLNENVSKSIKGSRSSGDMAGVMSEIRSVLYNPQACQNTFGGLRVDEGPDSIKDGNNQPLFLKGSKVGNGSSKLLDIKVISLDPVRYRALVKLDFEKTQKESGMPLKSYFINLFVDPSGAQITRCIDPSEEAAKATIENFCRDADPANSVPPGSNLDCEDNRENVIQEAKRLYCTSLPFLKYDAVSGKCLPLDSNRPCPVGQFLQSFGPNGELICSN